MYGGIDGWYFRGKEMRRNISDLSDIEKSRLFRRIVAGDGQNELSRIFNLKTKSLVSWRKEQGLLPRHGKGRRRQTIL